MSHALERNGVMPDSGVGSIATMLLAARGYSVAAVTGWTAEADYLTGLGAATIIDRAVNARLLFCQ